jgi:hypothetical protein
MGTPEKYVSSSTILPKLGIFAHAPNASEQPIPVTQHYVTVATAAQEPADQLQSHAEGDSWQI